MSTAERTITPAMQITFWLGFIIILGLSVWALQSILLPFILGGAIAYLLNPLVHKFGERNVTRLWATAFILLLFISCVAGLIVVLVPFLYKEVVQLAEKMPGYIDILVMKVQYIWQELDASPYAEHVNMNTITEGLKSNVGNALKFGGNVVTSLVSGGQILASFMTTLLITPLVAFFMMAEWDKITAWIDNQIPRHHYDVVKRLTKDIDGKIAGFVRGQIILAVFLGIIYATALTLAGLNYAVIIGLGAGLFSIIPLIGSVAGLLASTIVAWLQTGEITYTGMIAGIFVVGQIVEGNILAPRLLSKSVGLHPLWILFALIAGGSLLGITGMLLAVPFLASIGVLIGFGFERYRASPYYQHKETAKKTVAKKSTTVKKKASTKKASTKKTATKTKKS